MPFQIKPLSCDRARIKGMSERLIISHYDNNYGGAVKRLNVIEGELSELDYDSTPGFLINGLKREQLVAMNSMILHDCFSTDLTNKANPGSLCAKRLSKTLDRMSVGDLSLSRWERLSAAAPAGCCCRGRLMIGNLSISGRPTTATLWLVALQFSRSICMNTRITSILVPSPRRTSMHSWRRSAGTIVIGCSAS